MASYSTEVSHVSTWTRLNDLFGRFAHGVAEGFAAFAMARSRMHEIERLNAKSDEELARIGLERDQIARHVFRDLFYV